MKKKMSEEVIDDAEWIKNGRESKRKGKEIIK